MSDAYEINVSTTFPSNKEAQLVYDVISVDQGPRRSGATRELSVNNNSLEAKFTGQKASKLRTALTSHFDSLILVLDTMIAFHPDKNIK